jgi:pimeloyl-ACP methyl ester carboxylesterase
MPHAISEGARIHYTVEGEGPPVLLLPGLGMSAATWAAAGARLARSRRAIYADPRGSGESDTPDQPYTGPLVAADMAAVLDDAGVEQADVVGMSMGGMIAQHLALEQPERVRTLTLVSTYAATDEWTARVLDERRWLIDQGGLAAQFRLSIFFVFSPQAFREMPDFIHALETRLAEHPPDERAYRRQLEFCRSHDTAARLGGLRMPTLVIVGSHDVLTSPILARELTELVPGARYEEIAGSSHGMIWEHSDRIAELLLGFLDNA